MTYWSPRCSGSHRRFWARWVRVTALVAALALWVGTWGMVAQAAPPASGAGLPAVAMYGYAKGPVQQVGSAAGLPHQVPASATAASAAATAGIKRHPAPAPDLAPPAMGTGVQVSVGAAARVSGSLVADHQLVSTPPVSSSGSGPAGGAPSAAPSSPPSASASPSASPSVTATTISLVRADGASGTDNASYSVAATYDTVPMADQSGRIAVTLTNTGTGTWGTGYALGTQVFASGDATGTGTPITTGVNVPVPGTVAPGGTATVESVTPVRRCIRTTFRTSWAENYIEINAIRGIGGAWGIDGDGPLSSIALIEEWGYPKIGIIVCDMPSGGHDAIMLDYSGNNGEPNVVYIDEDRKPQRIAESFGEFLDILRRCERI